MAYYVDTTEYYKGTCKLCKTKPFCSVDWSFLGKDYKRLCDACATKKWYDEYNQADQLHKDKMLIDVYSQGWGYYHVLLKVDDMNRAQKLYEEEQERLVSEKYKNRAKELLDNAPLVDVVAYLLRKMDEGDHKTPISETVFG